MTAEIHMPRGWRTVPIPEAIDALPKDRRGFPIPYVAEWDSHSAYTPESTVRIMDGRGARIDCDCTPGVGNPGLGVQCPTRQRECMSLRKCQVCSLPISTEEDCYFLGGAPIETYIEPPLHKTCAIYSLQVCPGVAKRFGMSVHTCSDYALFDKIETFRGPQDGTLMTFVPTGEIPIAVALGFAACIFAMHGARPIGGRRILATEFLEELATCP